MDDIKISSSSNTLWLNGECVGAAQQTKSRDSEIYKITRIKPGLGLKEDDTITVSSDGKVKAKTGETHIRPLKKGR